MEGRASQLTAGLAALPPGYLVRAAIDDDLPALPAIELAAGTLFRTVGMDDVADDDSWDPAALRDARADGRLWVATHDGRPVGYVLALDLDGQAHLEQLSVLPEHGRLGLGAALVAAVVAWAEARGAPDLTLSTFATVPWNAPYYERLGFEVVAGADLSAVLRGVRAHEAEAGLDVDQRVIMRRTIGGASRAGAAR